ncbi:MAG: DUF1059 domain-containing protein [Armatimonadetes bacterium]|nr:MAG: DUF1059 domain-containing protein [Armatimonadota bacterium]
MYQFVCDHLVPGCTYKSDEADEKKTFEVAREHMRSHHDTIYHDDEAWRIINKAIIPIAH